MKGTHYYDQESAHYSRKRYPLTVASYVQWLFARRLALMLESLASDGGEREGARLLEIGCADGYVLSQIGRAHPEYAELIGIDTSTSMIDAARAQYASDPRVSYAVRDEHDAGGQTFDAIVEIGVLNFTDLHAELAFVRDHLAEDGTYICSLASSSSLIVLLRPQNLRDYRHCMTYRQYERIMSEYFQIEQRFAYGFFIPHLWKVPALARIIQPVAETIMRALAPGLFHETLYVLRKKSVVE